MTTRTYWVTTGMLGVAMLVGGVTDVTRQPANVQLLVQLGYPVYLLTILGVAKILAAGALFVPRWPRLREWAYAGIFFNMTGAAASHVAAGAIDWHVGALSGLTALTLASWGLQPASPARERAGVQTSERLASL